MDWHGGVLALIAQKKYFLLHAPRQTGKTTCLLALAEHLNRQGDYLAVYYPTCLTRGDDLLPFSHVTPEAMTYCPSAMSRQRR